MKKIKLTNSEHKGKAVVLLSFEKDTLLLNQLKLVFPRLTWSQSKLAWYVPYSPQIPQQLLIKMKGLAFINYSEFKIISKEQKTKSNMLSAQQKASVFTFIQYLKSKRYSDSTINTYVGAITTFLSFFATKDVADLENSDIIHFNNEYILKNNLSSSFQNQVVNAIRLFINIVDNRKLDPEIIHRPKRSKELPNVLSKEEVKLILNALVNIKHKAMLSLIYSCGLRSGELLRLMPEDVNSQRNILFIKQSKGKKDRIAPLSDKTVEMLRIYYKQYRPKKYLFEGQKEGEMYDSRSLQQVLKKAVRLAQIKKPVTLHWLRHSYATHLLEGGTDLRYIQEILGHSSSKTTEIYTHVSTKNIQQIKSPFDDL